MSGFAWVIAHAERFRPRVPAAQLIGAHVDDAIAAGETFDPWTPEGEHAFLIRNKPVLIRR